MSVTAPKFLEPAQNGWLGYILDLEAVIAQDPIAPVDDLNHSMEDVGVAAPIQRYIERAQSPLARPHHDCVPAIA